MNELKLNDIHRWTLLLLTALLLTACRSDDDSKESVAPDGDCYLSVTIAAPGRPVTTRADVGEINARDLDEQTVHTLKIWVFKHDDGGRLGYLETNLEANTLPPNDQYLIKIDKTFADQPENVDVYVVANEASIGLTTLGENTSRDVLDGTMIGFAYFGTTSSLTSSVPSGGLPMSASLKNQTITGQFPTLRIGTDNEIATLKLTRAVSRLRFIVCREADGSNKKFVSIDKITLHADLIPATSYLMPGSYSYTGSNSEIEYVTKALQASDVPRVKNPMDYTYVTQSAQEYEDLIDKAIKGEKKADNADENLKELGLTYFRETDKQLTGTIKYTTKNSSDTEEQHSVNFSMSAPGDFLRNHSWIVFIYFMNSELHVLTVTSIGVKEWQVEGSDDKNVYNW